MEPSEQSASDQQPIDGFVLRPWRPDEPTERAYVESTWRRNYDQAENTRCPSGIFEYIETQGQVIEQCLRTSSVRVACPPERPEQILGWCCYREGPVVHYVYVKPYYRRRGLGLSLLGRALGLPMARQVYTTHAWRRPHGEGIGVLVGQARAMGIVLHYNPALIFGGKP
jgi:acetyltransferase (GNAT) family protein